jgi:hypothetical protein
MKLLLGCFLTIVTFAMSYATEPVNLASGKKVSFFPPPNYQLCTDKQDAVQLTDGKYVTGVIQERSAGPGAAQFKSLLIWAKYDRLAGSHGIAPPAEPE